MPTAYPWHPAPQQQRMIVRNRPGSDPADVLALEWTGELFARARPADQDDLRRVVDDPMVFATSGLFDTQINGYSGRSFGDPNLGINGVRDLCWSILLSGTTRFLATITTDALDSMQIAMENVDAACRAYPDVAAVVAGIHQEGPWISPSNGPRGAHPAEHVVPPSIGDWARLQTASGGRIGLLTVAPEVEGITNLIREAARLGVVVSLGHHNADKPTIERAIEAGARCVTHLGNGCSAMVPRHPNLLWTQAAEDRLYAGIIADGHHLPPEAAKVLYRAKPRDKLILVSDAVHMAGALPGLYHEGDAISELTPQGRYGFYGTYTLIGAAVPLARCLANMAVFVGEGKTPVDYVAHATTVPGRLMGSPDLTAALGEPGTPATFVVWRWEPTTPSLTPQRIVLRGRTVYDSRTLVVQVPFGQGLAPANPAEAREWLATQRRI
jgi:N-acetylglucosamine-6-phosphate deacetylase